MEKLIVTAGLTGSRIGKTQTPHIPVSPEEIVRAGVEAWRAGAAVLHVHVRDPRTGLGTQDLAVFAPVVEAAEDDLHVRERLTLLVEQRSRHAAGHVGVLRPGGQGRRREPERRDGEHRGTKA